MPGQDRGRAPVDHSTYVSIRTGWAYVPLVFDVFSPGHRRLGRSEFDDDRAGRRSARKGVLAEGELPPSVRVPVWYSTRMPGGIRIS